MIKEATRIIAGLSDLTIPQMESAMGEIMSGEAGTDDIVSFLRALSKKGESIDELTAAVRVMRRFATRINTAHKVILDTCGTGADKRGTFNISTVVAFVVSGSGVAVAKHGNRSVSSKSGSADILEALGVNINMGRDRVEASLNEAGIAFLFAQDFHPAMKYAMQARRQIQERTIFNLIGPLTNPAQATHQLLGVFDRRWVETLAKVLANVGTAHALVVHGSDGLDEITTTGSSFISEEKEGIIKNFEVSPEDFGFKRASLNSLSGGEAKENAKILLEILKGEKGSRYDIVIMNAAAALYAADSVSSINEGVKLAEESIRSKSALNKLMLLKEYSNK